MNSSILEKKDKVRFYWPISNSDITMDEEELSIRTLDVIESYVYPLEYGLTKSDIADYLDNYSNMSFLTFLRYKCYISVDEDFLELMRQLYPTQKEVQCFSITIDNLNDSNIESLRDSYEKAIHYITDKSIILSANTTINLETISL